MLCINDIDYDNDTPWYDSIISFGQELIIKKYFLFTKSFHVLHSHSERNVRK